jgi:hypothetical protein
LLLGPMMYRHIFGSSVDREWLAEGAVNSFWKAHARPEFQEHGGGGTNRKREYAVTRAVKLKPQPAKKNERFKE